MKKYPKTGVVLTVLSLMLCSTSSTGPSTDLPSGITTETVDQKIGPDGGTISLSNGSQIVFPPQAVHTDVNLTVSILEPDSFFEPDSFIERIVFRCTGTQGDFGIPVQIRVPLPKDFSENDTGLLFGGYLDETTGLRKMMGCNIEKSGDSVWGVMELNHFSNPFMEWMRKKKRPPQSAGPLMVPYYGQGASQYCWAASLQMVTQFASYSMQRNIMEIIGETQVDEGGLTGLEFRSNSTISNIVKKRTGAIPDRCQYDFVNYDLAREFIKREIGLRGIPVAFHFTPWSHAIVIIGYNGNTFIAHDPAATATNSIGYKEIPWTDIKSKMGLGHNMTFLSIPGKQSAAPHITLNIMNDAFQFVKPVHPSDTLSRIYRFRWDSKSQEGYSVFDTREQERVAILPGTIKDFDPNGSIEVVNSSKTETHTISASMDLVCLAEKGYYHSQHITQTLPPNSLHKLKFQSVLFDSIRYDAESPVEYALTIRIFENSSLIDEQSVYFEVAPRSIHIEKATPESAGIGSRVQIKGYGFGTTAHDVRVTFSGKEALIDSASWNDTLISVFIPENAVTGSLQIISGKIKSNSVPFTITKQTVVDVPYSRQESLGEIVLDASVNVRVSAEIKNKSISDERSPQYYTVAPNVPSHIEVSVNATLDKSTIVQDASLNRKRVLIFKKPGLLSFQDSENDNFPVKITGEYPHTIGEQSIEFEFKDNNDNLHVFLSIPIYYDEELYDSSDVLIERRTDIYFNARTVGAISVDCAH